MKLGLRKLSGSSGCPLGLNWVEGSCRGLQKDVVECLECGNRLSSPPWQGVSIRSLRATQRVSGFVLNQSQSSRKSTAYHALQSTLKVVRSSSWLFFDLTSSSSFFHIRNRTRLQSEPYSLTLASVSLGCCSTSRRLGKELRAPHRRQLRQQ